MNKKVRKTNTDVAGADSPAEQQQPREKKREPVHSFHEGPIYVSVWGNEVQTRDGTRTFYSFTVRRAYQDKFGQMQFTNSIDARSTESLALAVQRVGEFLQSLTEPKGLVERGD